MTLFMKNIKSTKAHAAIPRIGKWVTGTPTEGEDLCDSMEFNYFVSGQRNDAKIFMFIVELMPE